MTAAILQDLPLQETVAPSDEPAVAALIAGACKSGTPVYPIGGGTSLDYGPRPARPGIGLSMSSMDRVLDHPADDLTITVEAGLTLAELNRQLAAKRQWLPIDAPAPARATVGGIVATNAFGPRCYAHGTIGDYLIGIRAIDGCGEAFAGGGRVVKNAAGYNLPRLMVGSLGTLGVITQATFMVRPLPTHSALVLCDVPDFQQAERLLAALGRSLATPMIVEMLAGPSLPNCPLPAMPDTAAARLAVGFEGGPGEVQGMSGVLCHQWQALGADGLTTITGARVDAVWNWLSEGPALLQINVLPSRLVEVMEQVARTLPAAPLQAHAGNGVLRVYPSASRSLGAPACGSGGADVQCRQESSRPLEQFRANSSHSASETYGGFADLAQNTLRPIAAAAGGHLTVLAAPADVDLAPADIWGPPRPGAALMRSIQQRFDPAGILNPGRMTFGK
jgi:glycolate oxidase FAD binding subunit